MEHNMADAYGFSYKLTNEDLVARQRADAAQQKQAAKWVKYVQQKRLPEGDALKKLCRRGIPPELRGWVWAEVSGAVARRQARVANYYGAMVHLGEERSECSHQIELDLPRTFPSNEWVASEEGQTALRRVLLAFSVHRPQVGYCQSMNYIVALLLLATNKREEIAFWVLVSLIDDAGILYRDMYASNLVGAHVEMRTLDELVAKKLPRVARHMQAVSCDMTILATDWFLCLYSTSLPAETVLRVWDALLQEGAKILYRVALAVLTVAEPRILAADNAGTLLQAVKHTAQHLHDRDQLLKIAFDGLGSLPMRRIESLREAKQGLVDTEFEVRQRNAALRSAVQASEKHAPVMNSQGLNGLAARIRDEYRQVGGRVADERLSAPPGGPRPQQQRYGTPSRRSVRSLR